MLTFSVFFCRSFDFKFLLFRSGEISGLAMAEVQLFSLTSADSPIISGGERSDAAQSEIRHSTNEQNFVVTSPTRITYLDESPATHEKTTCARGRRCLRWCCCVPGRQYLFFSLIVVAAFVASFAYEVALLRFIDGGVALGEFLIPDSCATSWQVPLSVWIWNPSPFTISVRDPAAFISPTAYTDAQPAGFPFAQTAPVSITLPALNQIDITPGDTNFNVSLRIAIVESSLFDALRFLKAHSSSGNYSGYSIAVFATISARVFGFNIELTSANTPLTLQHIDAGRVFEQHTSGGSNRTKPRVAMEIVAQRVQMEFGSGKQLGSFEAAFLASADLRAVLPVSRSSCLCVFCAELCLLSQHNDAAVDNTTDTPNTKRHTLRPGASPSNSTLVLNAQWA